MKCLLCGQTMKTVLTFSSLLLLRNDDSCLCSDCDSTFERIGEENCPNCMKTELSTKCQDCQLWCKEGVEVSHRAIFTYNQAMKDFFSRYKFDGDFLLRKVFASFLSEELKKYKEYQFVVIPLSPDRYANRGFNQVEGLGTELPFFIKSGVTIPKKILLIDDIYTTGATINRVKKLLEEAGAKDVKTFSLVR
ncbi:involved in transformation [Streptococcus pneumoniae]|uniref:ComF family protein n=1 Tax=Streptococcus pneumoniae TaxID=1313 RepID=UPI0005E9C242|nr:ComF family protein [Streptococcus pneumoniae]COG44595.1 involved in transformation [Streptococcus pneumoniae]COS39837.1 involved in transformation [Streptococcus pneumoniae]COT06558.1 involved in transformation [Streptococcus pneumoniae]